MKTNTPKATGWPLILVWGAIAIGLLWFWLAIKSLILPH